AYALTPGGGARLAAIHPLTERTAAARALAATAETVRFLADNQIGLQAPAEFNDIIAALGVEGRALEPLQLLALAAFLASVETTASAVRRARSAFPILRGI